MKINFRALVVLLLATAINSANADSFNLRDLLGGNKDGDSQSTLGSIVGNVVGNFISDKDVDPSQLEGEWKYSGPAVDFASDNALQNIGGAAAAAAVEQKLEPYYKKAGLNKLQFTADAEGNFTMKLKVGTLSGVIEKGENGYLVFNFQAFGKINIGKIAARATLTVNTLNLTFDVSGLVKIIKTVSSIAGNSAFNSLVQLLESYDGLYAGFKLTRSR